MIATVGLMLMIMNCTSRILWLSNYSHQVYLIFNCPLETVHLSSVKFHLTLSVTRNRRRAIRSIANEAIYWRSLVCYRMSSVW